jgi:hypothetical protein
VLHHLDPVLLSAEVECRRGYRGNGKLRRMLIGAVDPGAVRSVLELRFLELCQSHGIPRPLVNEQMVALARRGRDPRDGRDTGARGGGRGRVGG